MLLNLTIPPRTLETQPVKKSYDIGRAYVRGITVYIPDGHKYLARLEILTQGRALYANGSKYIVGDNNSIVLDAAMLEGPPFEITLAGWSEDDTYPHTFYLEVQ